MIINDDDEIFCFHQYIADLIGIYKASFVFSFSELKITL